VGSRTDIRVLDIRVTAASVSVDLATDGIPLGLNALERLASANASDVPVVIRTVPLTTVEATPDNPAQPSLD
jgi:hypothetical protein